MLDHLSKKQTSLLGGSIIFLAASMLNFMAKFAISVIVARSLGPTNKGIYILVLTTGSMLALLFNLGLGGAFTYLTASKKFPAQELFGFAVTTALGLGVGGGGLFYLLYSTFLANTFLKGASLEYMLMVLAATPINLLTSFFASILLGKQQLIAVNGVELMRVFSNLVLQCTSYWLGWGVAGAIGAWLASSVTALLLALWFSRSHFSLKFSGQGQLFRPAFSYGIKNYIANLFTFFNYRLDTFLVNYYAGASSLGQYTTGVTVAELLWYIPNAVSSALFPKSSGLPTQDAARITAQSCRAVLLILPPISIAFGAISSIAIPWIYTEQFRAAVIPFLLLLPGMIGIALSKIISASLSGRGKPHYATYTSVITVVVTVALDVVLIPWLDINGAAIASSIAYWVTAILSVIWFSREMQIPWQQVVVPTPQDARYIYQRVANLSIAFLRSRKAA